MSGFGISGLGSGIDWNNYIQAIRTAEESAIARTLGKRQAKTAAVQTTLSNFKGLADQLKTTANGFEFAKDFKTKSATSSDSSVITGTATLSSINQTNVIRVEQLATNEVWHGTLQSTSSSVTSADATLTITVRGQANVLNVTSGTTLSALADQINAANIGVSAAVFDTGAGTGETGRIAITDTTSGKSNPDQTAGVNFNLSFSSTLTELVTGDFGVSPIVEGKDAQVIINGSATMYRDSNTITDLIPGVNLNLVSADPGVDKTITISESSSAALEKVQKFVDRYNSFVQNIKKAIQVDPSLTEQTNPTAGNSTLRNVLTQLQSAVTGTVNSLPGDRSIRGLADLGITSSYSKNDAVNSGLLEIDQTKFNQAVSGNFDDVVAFFEGVKVNDVQHDGFGQKISDVMESILSFSSGTLPTAIKSLGEDLNRMDREITLKLERLAKKEEMLKDRFARLEGTLARLNSQQSSLTAALEGISGKSSKK